MTKVEEVAREPNYTLIKSGNDVTLAFDTAYDAEAFFEAIEATAPDIEKLVRVLRALE